MSVTDCAQLRGVSLTQAAGTERLRLAPWVAALAACLLGCATVPKAAPEESARARELAVPEGKALVYVFRAGLMAAASNFKLYANQELVGEIASDTFYVLESEPGDLRLDFPFGNSTTTLNLKLEAGRRYYVSQAIERTYLVLVYVDKATLTRVSEEDGVRGLGNLIRVVQLKSHQEEDRLARERQAPADRALVFVFCSRWLAPGGDFEIAVNSQPVGKLPARSFVVTEVAPGPVSIATKAENQGTLQVNLQAGTTAYVEVVLKMGFLKPSVELTRVPEEQGRMALAGLRQAPHPGTAPVAGERSGDRPPEATLKEPDPK